MRRVIAYIVMLSLVVFLCLEVFYLPSRAYASGGYTVEQTQTQSYWENVTLTARKEQTNVASTLSAVPTYTRTPTRTPTVSRTPMTPVSTGTVSLTPTSFDDTCVEGLPGGWGTETPSVFWWAECGHCLYDLTPTATPYYTVTATHDGTGTPYPSATSTPYVTAEGCFGTATATQLPPTETATQLPTTPDGTLQEETNPPTSYTGSWSSLACSSCSGNQQMMRSAGTLGDTAVMAFTGTSMYFEYVKSSNYGKFDIYLDGSYYATYDAFATSTVIVKGYVNNLSYGSHSVVIYVKHEKNSSSNGYYVSLSVWRYSVTVPPSPTPYPPYALSCNTSTGWICSVSPDGRMLEAFYTSGSTGHELSIKTRANSTVQLTYLVHTDLTLTCGTAQDATARLKINPYMGSDLFNDGRWIDLGTGPGYFSGSMEHYSTYTVVTGSSGDVILNVTYGENMCLTGDFRPVTSVVVYIGPECQYYSDGSEYGQGFCGSVPGVSATDDFGFELFVPDGALNCDMGWDEINLGDGNVIPAVQICLQPVQFGVVKLFGVTFEASYIALIILVAWAYRFLRTI